MIKFVLPLAALFTAAPAFADAPLAFQRDGMDVVGTVSNQGDVRIIKGVDRNSGKPFDLRVKKGYVTGYIDGQRVSYPAPKASAVQLASR
ncbi:hypothetical protein [uncultured Sphingomonas sp.]|uniref:hypothetical protein n=1 Tax=uncultured Sphingomonas sp. TaxID=158754 RepID=UPI0025FC19CB|nr:hypothetical protein [uncultured Sphingomonas sp.]